ncbi:MAG: PAS domain S-box protein [Phycisphaerae bacterium]|nr:PAS domain S-box protein [Phycisphaerae bacterium]
MPDRDRSERTRRRDAGAQPPPADEPLWQGTDELAFLSRVSRQLSLSLPTEEVFASTLEEVSRITRAELSVLYLVDGREMRLRAAKSNRPGEDQVGTTVKRVGECLCGLAAQSRQPVYSADLHDDPRCTLSECRQAGVRSFAALPLLNQNRAIGVLGLASFEKRDFAKHASALESIASQIATGLDNARLHEQLRHSEEALRASEAEKAAILDSLAELVAYQDLEHRILWANRAAEQFAGLGPGELVGRRCYEAWQGRADTCEGCPVASAIETGQSRQAEITSSEGKVWFLTANPVRDSQGRIIGAVETGMNITQRRQAERQIEELARFPSENPNPVLRVDKDGLITYANEASKPLLETWRCDVGRPVPADVRLLVTGSLKVGARREAEIRCGDRVLAVAFAPIVDSGWVNVYGLDITERSRAEEALRRNEATLRTVFRAAPMGIGLVSNRIFGWTNDEVSRMTGYARADLDGQSARMLYETQEEFERVGREKYEQTRKSGVGTVETRWRRRDGRVIDVLVSSSVIDPADLSAGTVFTAVDITDQKRAAEERVNLEAQVQQAQKLESLGVLAGGIAHDFNNLLTGILGNADLAMMDLAPTSPARPSIEQIQTASHRAADLCRQMLAYSGKGRFVIELLDVNELIREMTHLLEISVSKKAILKYHFADGLPAVEADATQIRQVVMNLITNASEALGEVSGVISISTGVMECDHAYLHNALLDERLPEGPYVYFEVADTGVGMGSETIERIFDPFFTTKFTGRGLGLAAVLGIVRGHRGALKVYSEPGKGTTFKMLLPAVDLPAEPLRGEADAPHAWRGAGTILLVDDEETIRTVAKRMVARLGFEVLTAADGKECIEIFHANADRVVCVLLDLTMPRMDGEETFRELRRIRPEVRVILSSGYNEQDAINRFAGKGLAGFIQKPYQARALTAKLREVLEE